mmetsp:Transcript_66483/g.185317  ORF Transcript_66483/g.185317 Transcript_66483/m.185317 type:complete len:322 (+) Transcript_66483:123-1088(+)
MLQLLVVFPQKSHRVLYPLLQCLCSILLLLELATPLDEILVVPRGRGFHFLVSLRQDLHAGVLPRPTLGKAVSYILQEVLGGEVLLPDAHHVDHRHVGDAGQAPLSFRSLSQDLLLFVEVIKHHQFITVELLLESAHGLHVEVDGRGQILPDGLELGHQRLALLSDIACLIAQGRNAVMQVLDVRGDVLILLEHRAVPLPKLDQLLAVVTLLALDFNHDLLLLLLDSFGKLCHLGAHHVVGLFGAVEQFCRLGERQHCRLALDQCEGLGAGRRWRRARRQCNDGDQSTATPGLCVSEHGRNNVTAWAKARVQKLEELEGFP